jgi:putative protease
MKAIELLAPAKDKHIGIQAILHGADAVYIGGPQYGARSAVGNSVEDIAELCRFAHLYRARVYVTLNTILYNDELAEAEMLIHRLYEAGVDALITQDLGLLEMNLPPIALHSSTQMDNRSVEDVEHRMSEGFTRVVLARELPLSTIKDIANRCQVDIEAFVHGALCVSYSGRCYASQYCFGRSANRGQCAQFCRLSFDLINQRGETLEADKH